MSEIDLLVQATDDIALMIHFHGVRSADLVKSVAIRVDEEMVFQPKPSIILKKAVDCEFRSKAGL